MLPQVYIDGGCNARNNILEVTGDIAFERLLDGTLAKYPDQVLTLKQLSAEAAQQGLRLVVSVNVRVETRQEHEANVRSDASPSST